MVVRELDLLYFNLFDDCNARCNMCTCWEAPRTRRETQYYLDSLDRLLALRPAAVRFTGVNHCCFRGCRNWCARRRTPVLGYPSSPTGAYCAAKQRSSRMRDVTRP